MVIQFLSVAAGGAAGACVRYAFALLFPFVPGQWPIASFTANILGCAIMGALFYLIQQAHLPLSVKPLLLAGFLDGDGSIVSQIVKDKGRKYGFYIRISVK